jgi:hypothetical protein
LQARHHGSIKFGLEKRINTFLILHGRPAHSKCSAQMKGFPPP